MDLIIFYAAILDIIMGDPRSIPHPVVYIGKAINWGERLIRRCFESARELKLAGVFLALLIVGGCYGVFSLILWVAFKINAVLGIGVSVFLMSQSLAMNSLYKHARSIARPLSRGDLLSARLALSMIVGRDTDNLDETEIIRGAVESVAENTVDGIIAPLFYGFIGGPALALAYKAVNTLDSMIGYKDERYIDLGWAAARLDDLANYIPARLSALLFLSLAPFTLGGLSGVWNTLRRDARRHPSPNSGFPEAAVAGALGVQLGGVNYYRGVPSNRALIGEKKHSLQVEDITSSLVIMAVVSAEMIGLGILVSQFFK